MSDLYNIPQDDGCTYRLKKFVEYQHEVPSIHYRFVGEWIRRNKYSLDDAVNMCWYMSATYNELSCVLIDRLIREAKDYRLLWKNNGEKIIFGSARKHVRYNDRFILLMDEWKRQTDGKPYDWMLKRKGRNPSITLNNIHDELLRMKEVGRFAADLFIETASWIQDYLDIEIGEPDNLDWVNCANLTSGTYNIFYEDERANLFDKVKTIPKSEYVFLNQCLEEIQAEIHKTYPKQKCTIYSFVGKICSFRNLFKGLRYGGFHHDRELGWLYRYINDYPDLIDIWNQCFDVRKDIFPNHLLGELNGWSGIRKERKRLWLDKGLTGVERYI